MAGGPFISRRVFTVAVCLALPACADDSGRVGLAPGPQPPADLGPPMVFDAAADFGPAPSFDAAPPDPTMFNCPEVPTAYVFEHLDEFTGHPGEGAALLRAAGFQVQPLPLDRNPTELRGLIFIGSFASQNPVFREYTVKNAKALYTFVDAANVLVEMAQADQTEQQPPFLPNSQSARRHDVDVGRLVTLDPQHPLLLDVPRAPDGALAWQHAQVGWETFVGQTGFAVLAAGTERGENAALMEGAYAQGRFILTAIASDKPTGAGPERDRFNQAFFRNLYQYTRAVCRRQSGPVKVTFSGRPIIAPTSFVIPVLPDTQYYSLAFPGIYTAQTGWIVANARAYKMPYVFHLGDIVDQNTPIEWHRAAQAMALLDGVVPYALATGNHDFGPSGSGTTRETLLNQYFPFEKARALPTFGGAHEPGKLENTYHLFSAGGRDYIVIALEWGPRNEVVAWADGVMAAHPTRNGILITHAYLNHNDRRYDIKDTAFPQDFNPHQYGTAGGVNDGEELWQKLVRRHRFVMTLNGHVLGDGTGYLASVTDRGNTCHQMLSNYQFRAQGGEGYLRLLEFTDDGRTVKVYSYSPLFDTFMTEADQNLTIVLD